MSGEPIYTWLPVMMMMKMMWFSLSAAMCASHTLRHTHTHTGPPPAQTDLCFYFMFLFLLLFCRCLFSKLHALPRSARPPMTDTCQQRHKTSTWEESVTNIFLWDPRAGKHVRLYICVYTRFHRCVRFLARAACIPIDPRCDWFARPEDFR